MEVGGSVSHSPLGSSAHHLPRAEHQSCGTWLSNPHNHCCKSLQNRRKTFITIHFHFIVVYKVLTIWLCRVVVNTKFVKKILNIVSPTFGLYSAFLAWRAIFLRSSLQPRLTVDTMFLHTMELWATQWQQYRGGAHCS